MILNKFIVSKFSLNKLSYIFYGIFLFLYFLYNFYKITDLSYFIIINIYILSLINPSMMVGWFLLCSVTFDSIFLLNNYIYKLIFILIILISLLIKNKNNLIPQFKYIQFLFIYICLLVIPILNFNLEINWLTNPALNTNNYFVNTLFRHSIFIIIFLLIFNIKEESLIFTGFALSFVSFLLIVGPDFYINSYRIFIENIGGVGAQNQYLNRADFSYKFALSYLSILFNLQILRISFANFSLLILFLSAGKIAAIVTYVLTFWYLNTKNLITNFLFVCFIFVLSLYIFNLLPVNFILQHYGYLLIKGISTRIHYYFEFISNINLLKFNNPGNIITGIPIEDSEKDQLISAVSSGNISSNNTHVLLNSISGSHNLFFDVLAGYGVMLGTLILAIILIPIVLFMKRTRSFLYRSICIIILTGSFLTFPFTNNVLIIFFTMFSLKKISEKQY